MARFAIITGDDTEAVTFAGPARSRMIALILLGNTDTIKRLSICN